MPVVLTRDVFWGSLGRLGKDQGEKQAEDDCYPATVSIPRRPMCFCRWGTRNTPTKAPSLAESTSK